MFFSVIHLQKSILLLDLDIWFTAGKLKLFLSLNLFQVAPLNHIIFQTFQDRYFKDRGGRFTTNLGKLLYLGNQKSV